MARFSLFDEDTDGNDDLDLYVIDQTFTYFVGQSGSPTSAEQVDIVDPSSWGSIFLVAVHGWQTDGPDASYTLSSWFPAGPAGNMEVDSAPASAELGQTGTIEFSWESLAPATRYLGSIEHQKDGSAAAQTIISVTTD